MLWDLLKNGKHFLSQKRERQICDSPGEVGADAIVAFPIQFKGEQYIHLGDGCYIGPNCSIGAWARYGGVVFSTPPIIRFGDHVRIAGNLHCGAINMVVPSI